jgi:Na+/melibiose symporter-like transporter
VFPIFILFFLSMAFRNVAYQALTSKVPRPHERARFMSIQSAVQSSASAIAGFLATAMLTTATPLGPAGTPLHHADGSPVQLLVGMSRVAWVAIILACSLPVLIGSVEAAVKRRRARELVPLAAG